MTQSEEIIELKNRVSALEQRLMMAPISVNDPVVHTIKRLVCEEFGVRDIAQLDSASREQPLAYARQVAMFLVHEFTSLGTVPIGKAFGNRDHATVIHACKVVKEQCEENSDSAERVTRLSHIIKNWRS